MTMHREQPKLHPDMLQAPYTLLGQGGEHIVVGNPYLQLDNLRRNPADAGSGPAIASKYSRLAFIALNTPDVAPEQALGAAVARAEGVNRRHDRLKNFFGLGVVDQMSEGRIIQLDEDEVRHIWGVQTPPRPAGDFATVVTHQVRVAGLETPPAVARDFISVDLPYAERHAPVVDPDTYSAVNQRWLAKATKNEWPTDTEIEQFLAVHHSPGVRWLVEVASGRQPDKKQRIVNVAGAFAWYAANYSNHTGEILDMSSPNNVAFREAGPYRLLDALFPSDAQLVYTAPDVVQKAQDGFGLTYRDRIGLLNALGYVRTVNLLTSFHFGPTRIEHFARKGIRRQTWDIVYEYLTHLPTKDGLHGPTALYVE